MVLPLLIQQSKLSFWKKLGAAKTGAPNLKHLNFN
jgi:hypothetical protein